MQKYYTLKGKHLTIDNRRLIERWKKEGKSNREIAGLLGKAPQTINNEVNRGTTLQQVRKGVYKKVYSADYAQTVYQNNRKRSVKKLILTKEIKEKILHYHKQKFSPEMMVKKKLPARKSIEERPEVIILRLENGHYEIDTVLLTKVKIIAS
ncbi:IS1239 transposase [Streptococcus suis]|uniref:IS1239 transposase n=1 Tax=Streptococcus suis TaxID=1307 RepID=A0A0Z8FYK3_STRSU|nr:IS1239 transposase [Streptococcus suis]